MSKAVVFFNAGGKVGGAEHSLLLLLAGLDRARYQPVLCCPANSELAHRATALGVPVIALTIEAHNLGRRPHVYVRTLLSAFRALRGARPALLHGNGLRSAHYVVPLGRLLRVPTVLHIRDITLPPARLARFLIAKADCQVAISEAVRAALSDQGLLANCCRVIANGVEIERFVRAERQRERMRAALGLASDTVAVGVVGRLFPWKGQLYAVEAAGRLAEQGHLRWLIVGEEWSGQVNGLADGQSYTELLRRRVEELGLGTTVRLLGSRRKIPELMAGVDVLVVPSAEPEPFGRVAIEAMAAGRPVVATYGGGLAEIVTDGISGFLVPPRDAQAIADRVAELAADPLLRARMGEAGRAIVKRQFSAEVHLGQIEALYDELVA